MSGTALKMTKTLSAFLLIEWSVAVDGLSLLFLIRKMTDSNCSPNATVLADIPQFLQENAAAVPEVTSQLLHSTQFTASSLQPQTYFI
jgi:hypothetical protein